MKYKPLNVDSMPDWIAALCKPGYSNEIVAGVNDDDCAIIDVGDEQIVISSDYLNANPIAIELKLGDFWDLGRLLVASNISDMCGTGALPLGFLSSIMLKKEESNETDFQNLIRGIKFELDKHNIPLIGGDSKLGKVNCFCGMIIGKKQKGTKLFLKNAAEIGDTIWVSGNIGGVAAAIKGINLGTMSPSWNDWAKKKIINPNLPLNKSRLLAEKAIPNGGTDISDGLGADLWNLCTSSKVGAEIITENIPYDVEVDLISGILDLKSWMFAFTIGGDFQFLFTANKKYDSELFDLGFSKIGRIIKDNECYIINNNERFVMPKIGHLDSNANSFSEEIAKLLNRIT